MRLLISSLLLFSSFGLLADDVPEAEIRLQASSEEATWVGQERELYLELWSNGFSFSSQLFILPEVAGAYLLQADSSTVKLSERRGDQTWQGLRYYLLLYPQRAGTVELPSFEVRFSVSAGYGKEPSDFVFHTEALPLRTRMPPGADPAGLVVTSPNFSMLAKWRPDPSTEGLLELEVGDALSLEVERTAKKVPGMVFSPLPEPALAGFSRYTAPPRVDDRINRGELIGSRTDKQTYICEQEGEFTIPGISFQWYDPDKEVLEQLDIPELNLVVRASTAYGSGGSGTQGRTFDWWLIPIVVVSVLALLTGGRRLSSQASVAWHSWRERVRASERWAFRQVRKACRTGQTVSAYAAISNWLSHPDGVGAGRTLLQFANDCDDADLTRQSLVLQDCLAVNSAQKWRGGELAKLLKQQRVNPQREVNRVQGLPPLNP